MHYNFPNLQAPTTDLELPHPAYSLLLLNLESYNAVLINQGKMQKERMELLRQLAVQQLQTLETVSLNDLPKLGTDL